MAGLLRSGEEREIMATVVTQLATAKRAPSEASTHPRWLFGLLCTALALLLLGYHPAAEDGGIYAAATAARLHPALFPAEHAFAVAQSQRSLFVPLLALWARLLHLPLPAVLLLTFALTIAATVAAADRLLRSLFDSAEARRGALLLFAVSLGLPLAGTSLYLADPYLTARSVSTPLLLLALAWLLERRPLRATAAVVGSLAVHPLMALCTLPLIAALPAASRGRWWRWGLYAAAVAAPMLLLRWLAPTDLSATRAASLTRLYWFPERWAWFEWVGLIAPVALLLWLRRTPGPLTHNARRLALAVAVSTACMTAGTVCLVRETNRSLLLARLQPLRLLHPVYCIFLLLLGGWLASRRWRALPWAAAALAGGSLLLMQRELYRGSNHLELPGRTPVNGWVKAFEWARDHTPPDALFALDADYTRAPGEDAQLFRAIALRSALPDEAKDGGVASVVPSLAEEWRRASEAQRGLATLPDAERARRLQPFGATWIVLPAESPTAFDCPYRNAAAQVCRLP